MDQLQMSVFIPGLDYQLGKGYAREDSALAHHFITACADV